MTPTNATISSDVNIRSGAGTSYTKIGSLTAGTNLVVIGQAKDDAGDIWYQFYTTGTDQQMIGFARYDYVTLGDPVQTAAPADTSTENSDADASEDTSSGDKEYEAVYADDGTGSGTKVWYLYNYKTGTRKEISKMEDAITESNQVVTGGCHHGVQSGCDGGQGKPSQDEAAHSCARRAAARMSGCDYRACFESAARGCGER